MDSEGIPVSSRPEEQLVREALKGNADALDELARRYSGPIVRLATRLVGDLHEAEDIAQESLGRAFENLGQLKEPAKFGPWLNSIAINECRRHARQDIPISFLVADTPAPDEEWPSSGQTLGAVLAETASRMLDLPPGQAAPAAWFYFHGTSYAELAEMLDTTPAAVQSSLQRARATLRGEREHIYRRGEAAMENTDTELDLVVSTADLLARKLCLGERRWGENHFSAEVTNRSQSSLRLALDIRTCLTAGNAMNWQRQWYYELAPGENRQLTETYRISRVFLPWYSVFRGPSKAMVRITFALATEEQLSRPKPGILFGQLERILFQKWFDVVVPADSEEQGTPVKPILPEAGDITLENVDLSLEPGEHECQLTLCNHTRDDRAVVVRVCTPGMGISRGGVLTANGLTDIQVRYRILEDWQRWTDGRDTPPDVVLRVIQFPLNLEDLDIDGERGAFLFHYERNVAEATAAIRRWALG